MKKICITIFFLILVCIDKTIGQTSQPNKIQAYFTTQNLTLDGILREPEWKKANKISNFTQRELNEGQSVTEKTKTAVVYNKRYLYIGVWCFDENPDKIIAKELRRDFNETKDANFKVIFDTYHDKRNGFLFIINPNGARKDLQVFNNGSNTNKFWDGVWNAEARITPEGWFAEIRIPLSTLKYKTGISNQKWGINFERNIRHKREQVLWQGWSRDASLEEVNRAGDLTGLDKLRNKDFVELKPYGITGMQWEDNKDLIANAGGDINYLVTPTLQTNLTFNTDFAQVQADRQQINLTRFPLFFPERREFFLEGENYFNMGFGGNRIIPFYSRRIGLTKDREKIPILGGGRILGKIKNTTLGAMSLQTAKKRNIPTTNYSVASWRQDVLSQSTAGIMTVNKYAENRLHSTTGINGRYSTSKLFGDKNLNISGAYIQNYNSDTAFNKKARAFRMQVFYPNDLFNIFASWQRSPPDFNPEVGLMRRRSFKELFGLFTIKPRPKNHFNWIRQFFFMPANITYTRFYQTGEIQTFIYRFQPLGFDTKSGESVDFNIERSAEGVKDTFLLQDNINVYPDTYWQTRFNASFSTFSGRNLSGSLDAGYGDFFNGNSLSGTFNFQWRTSKYLTVNLKYERNQVDFPDENFTTHLFANKMEYAITPDIFGTMLTQWNNNRHLFNINFRLEWIPTPGTNFYFIVNQNYFTNRAPWQAVRTTIIGKLIWRFVI